MNKFLDRLQKDGYRLKGRLEVNSGGTWGRLYYMDEKRDSGRYKLTVDGDWGYATYGSDKDPRGFQTWRSWEGEELSDREFKERVDWARAKEEEHRKQEQARHAEVALKLTMQWGKYEAPPQDHPYAVMKDIGLEQARYLREDNALLLPAVDVLDAKKVYSMQYIYADGEKFFEPGGRIKGTVCPLKRPDEPMEKAYLCEGYATGMTIREATGLPVFVAWNAGNMIDAAATLRQAYPDTQFFVAADNDWIPSDNWGNKKWYNAGIEKGKIAAGRLKTVMLFPEFTEADCETIKRPSDWNDYACIYGIDAVKSKLLGGAVQRVEPTTSPAHVQKSDTLPPSPQHSKITAQNWINAVRWKDSNPQAGIYDNKFSMHNAKLLLEFDPLWRGTFVFDEFEQTQRILRPLPWDNEDTFQWRCVEDTDLTNLRINLSLKNIVVRSNTEMKQIIDAVALDRSVHPVRAYFDKLEWDGVDRLDNWAIDYLGATEQDEMYVRAISRCWLIAAVKRIYEPGADFHHMLVLEGGQAAGKSSFLKSMATFGGHKYFSDSLTFDLIKKPLDVANLMRGCIIVEFAEMSGKSASDRERIKQWITWTHDEYVPKFSNQPVRQPRQCVFAGSTNETTYLDDPTGGRRFWPLRVGQIDHEEFEEVKTQVWAEAIHRYKAGEIHYIPVTDPIYKLAQAEQSRRYSESPWKVLIETHMQENSLEEMTTAEIMHKVLAIPQERWGNKQYQAGIGDVMRELGFESKLRWDSQLGKQIRKWTLE